MLNLDDPQHSELAASLAQDDSSMELRRAFRALRRRWFLVVMPAVILGLGCFIYFHHKPKQYTASASLSFNNNSSVAQVAGLSISSATQDSDTNAQLASLGNTTERTAETLGLKAKAVQSMLSIRAVGTSSIVAISATTTSPSLAASVANTYAESFVSQQAEQNRSAYLAALSLVSKQLAKIPEAQRSGTGAIELQTRAQTLGLLAAEVSNTVSVAQRAEVPTSPSGPPVTEYSVVGFVLGGLLGLGIAFLLTVSDTRLREPEEIVASYGVPQLGVIPTFPQSGGADEPASLRTSEPEAFQLIQAHLRFYNVDTKIHVILVTSASSGDGKTTASCQLAAAASRLGTRVLLIEADLRRPRIAASCNLSLEHIGLSDVVIGETQMDDAIQPITVDPSASLSSTFDVLLAGTPGAPNPAALFDSEAMTVLLNNARASYELVIIDTPPVTVVSDCYPLLQLVDGVIVIARVGNSTREAVALASETLRRSGRQVLGVVINGVKQSRRVGYYGYVDQVQETS